MLSKHKRGASDQPGEANPAQAEAPIPAGHPAREDAAGAEPASVGAETSAEDGTAAYTAVSLAKKRRKKKRRRILRKTIIWLLALAALGFAAWLWVQKTRAEYRTEYDPYTAALGTISNSLSYSGSLQLVNSKTYTASSSSKVSAVYVARGDTVSAGDRLLRLRDGTTFTADFDGTVNSVAVEAGDEVSQGTTLLKLVDFDHMRVSIRISAANIGEVQEGTPCRVTVSTAGVSVGAQIGEIDFSTYSGNNTVYYSSTVDVDLTGTQGAYPGMTATITVPQEEAANVVILKADAISTAADNSAFVYKLQEDGTMAASPVTLGVSNGSYTEIREGVAEGETVYAVVARDESSTGWASILQSAFGSQQVNQPAGGMSDRQGFGGNSRNNGTGGSDGNGGNGGARNRNGGN